MSRPKQRCSTGFDPAPGPGTSNDSMVDSTTMDNVGPASASDVGPTATPGGRQGTKKRQPWFRFTAGQLKFMEEEYLKLNRRSPARSRCAEIADLFNLRMDQIVNWFKRRRENDAKKAKRDREERGKGEARDRPTHAPPLVPIAPSTGIPPNIGRPPISANHRALDGAPYWSEMHSPDIRSIRSQYVAYWLRRQKFDNPGHESEVGDQPFVPNFYREVSEEGVPGQTREHCPFQPCPSPEPAPEQEVQIIAEVQGGATNSISRDVIEEMRRSPSRAWLYSSGAILAKFYKTPFI